MQLGSGGAGAKVEVFVDETQVDAMMTRLEVALSPESFGTFLEGAASEHFHMRAEQRFVSEGDDASGAWANLRPRTIEERIYLGYGPGPIQHREGDLEKYVIDDHGVIEQLGTTTQWTWPRGTTGSSLDEIKYAVAQTGRKRGATTQVKRPIVAMNTTDAGEVLAALEMHVLDQLASASAGGPLTYLFGGES